MFKFFYAVILATLAKWELTLPLAKRLLNVKGTLRISLHAHSLNMDGAIAQRENTRSGAEGNIENLAYNCTKKCRPLEIIREAKVRRDLAISVRFSSCLSIKVFRLPSLGFLMTSLSVLPLRSFLQDC